MCLTCLCHRSEKEKSPSDLRQKVGRKREKKTGSESESDTEKVNLKCVLVVTARLLKLWRVQMKYFLGGVIIGLRFEFI